MIGGQTGMAGSGIKGNSESIWWTDNYNNEQVWRRGKVAGGREADCDISWFYNQFCFILFLCCFSHTQIITVITFPMHPMCVIPALYSVCMCVFTIFIQRTFL